MFLSVLLVFQYRVQVDVFQAVEDVGRDLGILFRQGGDQLLHFQPLGIGGPVGVAGGAGFRELATTSDGHW